MTKEMRLPWRLFPRVAQRDKLKQRREKKAEETGFQATQGFYISRTGRAWKATAEARE